MAGSGAVSLLTGTNDEVKIRPDEENINLFAARQRGITRENKTTL